MVDSILERYEEAQEVMQGILTNRIVRNDAVFPHWIEGGSRHFWYIREVAEGTEFRLVNVCEATNIPAFDHHLLAKLLGEEVGELVSGEHLPIKNVSISFSPLVVFFEAFSDKWRFDSELKKCSVVEDSLDVGGLISPDGKSVAFTRANNIWVRCISTGKERALTEDGAVDYFYGDQKNTYENSTQKVQALWSSDSKYLLTHLIDIREVTERPAVHYVSTTKNLNPKVSRVKLAYPGDEEVETYRLITINVASGEVINTDYSSLPFWGLGEGFFTDEKLAWWSNDNIHAYFVDVTRGAKTVSVVELNARTGATRVLFSESSNTYVSLSPSIDKRPIFMPLPGSNEILWYSERTDWAHLYLYDLTTGELKHPITEGLWLVHDILHYDEVRRELLLQTSARDKGISPYYRDICKVNIDSCKLEPLVEGNFDHMVYRPDSAAVSMRNGLGLDQVGVCGISPDGEFLIFTRSRVDTMPVSVLVDRQGSEVMRLEVADISGLPKAWSWPQPVKVKSSDHKTDIYGVVFRPPGFSEENKYPVLDYSCSIRCFSYIPHGSFINGCATDYVYFLGVALASLGFVVVALAARGTPNRDKAYRDYNYGSIESTCDLDDRISGIQQLALKFPYMDISRVGLTGTDNLATPVYGILRNPDFYKVAVLHCYMEPRFYYASIGEQYEGITSNEYSKSDKDMAESLVESLDGKLLLIHGMLDPVTPSSMFRLVDALQKANKDFDMLCLPNASHEVTTYALRRNWDYLVMHLHRVEPPKEFSLKTGVDILVEQLKKLTGTGSKLTN